MAGQNHRNRTAFPIMILSRHDSVLFCLRLAALRPQWLRGDRLNQHEQTEKTERTGFEPRIDTVGMNTDEKRETRIARIFANSFRPQGSFTFTSALKLKFVSLRSFRVRERVAIVL